LGARRRERREGGQLAELREGRELISKLSVSKARGEGREGEMSSPGRGFRRDVDESWWSMGRRELSVERH